MLFNANDISKVDEIVDTNIKAFIAENVGKFAISTPDKQKLKEAGFDIDLFDNNTIVALAYKFGMFEISNEPSYTKDVSLYQFEKIVKSNKFLPLSEKEQASLNSIQLQAGSGIDLFGDKLSNKFKTVLSDLNEDFKNKMESETSKLSKQSIERRESVKELASRLYHFTPDITRDLIRVSQYMLHTANEYGSADEIERVYGKDVRVYKRVYAGSCKTCEKLYLTKGFGSEPRYFKIPELRANGSNIGRTQANWKPTIDATHPFCRCSLMVAPNYLKWNPKTKKLEVSINKEANQAEINRLQAIIAERRGMRGIFTPTEIKKGYDTLFLGSINKSIDNNKIMSPYKAVNEYEKEFNLRLGRLVNKIVQQVQNEL